MLGKIKGLTRANGSFFQRVLASKQQQPYDFAALMATARRHLVPVCVWLVVCEALATGYLLCTPAEYTAFTQIVLETPKRPRLVLDADGEAVPIDSAQADSRIQVIKSERLLRFVFDTLKLADRPDAKKPSSQENAMSPEEIDKRQSSKAFLDFMDRVSARRIGLSYVLELAYRAKSPLEATQMVNSITSAYIRDLVLSTPRDSEVMQRRIVTVSHDAEILLAAVKSGTIPDDQIVGIDARVIGAAIEPLHKSSPHTLLTIIFAFLIGLTTGSAAILFAHNRDRRIRTKSAAKRLFGPDLIGHVSAASHPSTDGRTDIEDILHILPTTERHLRIGVISWQNLSAASVVAHTLAGRLSDDGPVCLLTSAPRPIPRGLNADTSSGLSMLDIDLKRGGRASESHLTEIKRLHTSGHVVVDLPPLESSSAALTVSKSLDGVLLVIEQGATTQDEVLMALNSLKAASAVFLGFVFYSPSRVPRRPSRFPKRRLKATEMVRSVWALLRPSMMLRARRPANLSRINRRG